MLQWGLTAFVIGGVVGLAAYALLGIWLAMKPVRDAEPKPTLHGYDVVKVASAVARDAWQQEDEVAW